MRLRFSLLVALSTLLLGPSALAQTVFVNEFHYDDDGADEGEFVEIAVADFVDIDDVRLTLYNGNGGVAYASYDTFTPGASSNGYTLYTVSTPGLQNGSPDGIALSSTGGDLYQFISYEGSFTAVDGPAQGETSDDVGVEELSSTPAGQSLQLTGTGAEAGDFSWTGPEAESPGAVNAGQTFEMPTPPPPDPPEVRFAEETLAVREGDTLRVPVELDYGDASPTGPVTVRVSFVGGASSASADDFASGTVAVTTFPGTRRGESVREVEFVFADDGVEEPEETAAFRLSIVSGSADLGSPNILTARINDAPETATVADARAAGPGESVTVEAVVSRAEGAFVYVQDETGGLAIRQTSGDLFDGVASGDIGPGTILDLTGTLSEFRSLLQINEGDLEAFEIVGTGPVPRPQIVTLAELAANGEAYEGELVYVADVSIQGSGDFTAATTYGISDDSDDSGVVTLRVPNEADGTVDGSPIPTMPVGVVGIVGQFSPEDPAAGYQLLVLDEADIDADAPSANVVMNGSFEMPGPGPVSGADVPGFTLTSAAGVAEPAGFSIVDDPAYDGEQALAVTVNGTGANPYDIEVAAQPLNVVGGQMYTYSIWARSETAGGTASFTVGEPAPSYAELARIDQAALTTEWQEFTVEFTVPEGVTEIRAPIHFSYAANVGNTIYVDALSITPVGGTAAEGPADAVAATLTVTNPIRSAATVRYAVETPGAVTVALFDVLGRQVAVVADGPVGTSEQTARFDATGLASGVYVLRLQGEGVMVSRTVTVVR